MARRYRIGLLPSAERQLAKLKPSARHRLESAIDRLAADPRPTDARMLRGLRGLLRIRVGDHRIIYQVVDDQLLVLVIRIGHRSEAYRAAALRQVRRTGRLGA